MRKILIFITLVISLNFNYGQEIVKQNLVEKICQSSGVGAGLCVFIGLKNSQQLMEFAKTEKFLIHGISTDKKLVNMCREIFQKNGTYGINSIIEHSFHKLPYTNNLVNMIVIEDLNILKEKKLSLKEITRVLCPNGVILIKKEKDLLEKFSATHLKLCENFKDETFCLYQKPWPENMGEWTHLAYDASGSYTSKDTILKPVSRLQWTTGPTYYLYPHKTGGITRILSAGGRNIYFSANVVPNLNKKENRKKRTLYLFARDAFNGLLLWMIPIKNFFNNKRPVASRDHIFTVMNDKIVSLNALSGKIVKTYNTSPGYTRYINSLLYSDHLLISTGRTLKVFDLDSGKILWEKPHFEKVVIGKGKIYFISGDKSVKNLVCHDLKTGKQIWSKDTKEWNHKQLSLFCYKNEILLLNTRTRKAGHNPGILVVSAKNGKLLWKNDKNNHGFFVSGLIWIFNPNGSGRSSKEYTWQAFQPQTGILEKKILVKTECKGYFGSCGSFNFTACTENYFIFSRPNSFMSWKNGKIEKFSASRGTCGGNTTPANGLLYNQATDCNCIRSVIRGVCAFAPEPVLSTRIPGNKLSIGNNGNEIPIVIKGPAFGAKLEYNQKEPKDHWPGFRYDDIRSNYSPRNIKPPMALLWQSNLGGEKIPQNFALDFEGNMARGPYTQPVIAENLVVISSIESHQIIAFNAETGKIEWKYTSSGRVDTSPTIYKGLCLFGSRNGWVTCLRLKDGAEVWKFQAAPMDRLIMAYGQLESSWPIQGGVLIADNLAYFVAGRNTEVDQGIYTYAIDPLIAKVVWKNHTFNKGLSGYSSDILRREKTSIWMGFKRQFDLKNGQDLVKAGSKKIRIDSRFIFDNSWARMSGAAQISFFNKSNTRGKVSHLVVRKNQELIGFKTATYKKKLIPAKIYNYSKSIKDPWLHELKEPMQVEAMIGAGEHLYVAGSTDRFDLKKQGFLWILSIHDGKILQKIDLPLPPVVECMSTANGKLFIITRDGKILCFGKK